MFSFRKTPIYPLLLAIYLPLISLSANWGELSSKDILSVLAISLAVTTIVWVVLYHIIKKRYTVSFIVAALVLVFYTYGHILFLMFVVKFTLIPPSVVTILFFVLLGLAIIVALPRDKQIERFTFYVNIVTIYLTIALLVVNPPLFVKDLIPSNEIPPEAKPIEPIPISTQAKGYGDTLPDIYLIVLDAGARDDVFADMSGEELGFAEELEALGFYVARDSKTNYVFTPALLPSLLNFDYIPSLIDLSEDIDVTDHGALVELMRDNRLCRTLKNVGYEVLTFNSTWGPTRDSVCADKVYETTSDIQEVTNLMINTTLLRLFLYDRLVDDIRNARLEIYDQLVEIAQNDAPNFTFVHLVLPHQPYVFDENGDIPDNIANRISIFSHSGNDDSSAKLLYLDQYKFTAQITVETVQKIIEESDVPPIIIVMSDHGPDLPLDFNNEFYEIRIPIVNAYYFPYGGDADLYPTISPVNSIRVLLNYYFEAGLPLLEQRIYTSNWRERIYYDFNDITTRTLQENKVARIGIDWDEEFYEIYAKQDGEFVPVLQVEMIDTEQKLVASNGWDVEVTTTMIYVHNNGEEIISLVLTN